MRLLWCILIFLLFNAAFSSAAEMVKPRPYSRHVSFTGFTRPVKELTITAEIAGKCVAVHVDVGDAVAKDARIAELDATFVKLEIENNKIAQQRAVKQLRLERKTLARFENLRNQKSTPEATYDEAVLRAEVLELTLKSLRNEEETLKERLKRHILNGPPGWQVIDRLVEPGEYLRQGQAVVTLGNFKSLVIPLLLTFEELLLLQGMTDTAQGVSLFFADFDKVIAAEIYRVSPDFDENKRKIAVDLRIHQETIAANPQLRGGLRGQLVLSGKVEENTYRIPYSAVISRYEAHWILSSDGRQQKVILIGRSKDGSEAIVSGENIDPTVTYYVHPEKHLKQ